MIFGDKEKIAFEVVSVNGQTVEMNLFFGNNLVNSEDNSYFIFVLRKNLVLELERLQKRNLEVDLGLISNKSDQDIFYYFWNESMEEDGVFPHTVLDYDLSVTRFHCILYQVGELYNFMGSYLSGDSAGSGSTDKSKNNFLKLVVNKHYFQGLLSSLIAYLEGFDGRL